MSKWIDADELRNFIKDQYFKCDMPKEWGNGVMWATSQINHYCNKADTPTIEPKRGEWIDTSNKIHYKCSVCDYRAPMIWEDYEVAEWLSDFCPNCGADMKGADDDIR